MEEITPIFNSMSDNEKFCYILQNREYDVLYICISHVYKMFEARDIIISNSSHINCHHVVFLYMY